MSALGQAVKIKGKSIKAKSQPKEVQSPSVQTQKARSVARAERKAIQRSLINPAKQKNDEVVKAPVKGFVKHSAGKFVYGISVPRECFDAAVKYVEENGWKVKMEYDGMSTIMSGNVTTIVKNWTGQFITGWLAGSQK